MAEEDRNNLINNIISHLGNAQERLQLRQTALFYKVEPEYGLRVAEELGLTKKKVEDLAYMTQNDRVKMTK
jgi:catalase